MGVGISELGELHLEGCPACVVPTALDGPELLKMSREITEQTRERILIGILVFPRAEVSDLADRGEGVRLEGAN
jgi:hypothetical protein